MPLVTTREIVERARSAGHGAGAFNVISLEHAEGIVAGAEAAGSAVILQISENAVRFHGGRVHPIAGATVAVAEAASVAVSLHLDHVEDRELLHQAASARFSSVMYDASKLDYAGNVTATRTAADWAHAQDLWLEAELGEIGGKDGAHAPGVRTRPEDAADFVAQTGVDALAVAVGSSHAMTTQSARLDHDLIAALRDAVSVPLVLHGSSGVADDELRQAVRHGIVKVNVGTSLNVAYTAAVREALLAQPQLVDPRRYLDPARDRVADVVQRILSALNATGR